MAVKPCQTIVDYFSIKNIAEQVKSGAKTAVYNFLASMFMDALCTIADEVGAALYDAVTMMENLVATVENIISLVDFSEWMYYAQSQQILLMKEKTTGEINYLSTVITAFREMKDLYDPKKGKYTKMNAIVARYLASSLRSLELAIGSNTANMMSIYFKSSHRKMEGLESALSFEKNNKLAKAAMASLRKDVESLITGKKRIKNDNEQAAVIDAVFGSLTNAPVDMLKVYRTYLLKYAFSFKNYYGSDIDNIVAPLVDQINYLIQSLNLGRTVPPVSPGNLLDQLHKNQKKILSGILGSDLRDDTHVYGCSSQRKGLLATFKQIAKMMKKSVKDDNKLNKESLSTRANFMRKLVDLKGHKVFESVKDGHEYNLDGKIGDRYRIDGRGDRLNFLFTVRDSLLKYNRIEKKELIRALSAEGNKEFHGGVMDAYDSILALEQSTVGEVMGGRFTGKDSSMTVEEYMEQVDTSAITMFILMGASILTMSTSGEVVPQSYIDNLMARRAILQRYRVILNEVPLYENEKVEALIAALGELGLETLVANLKSAALMSSGVQNTIAGVMDVASMIGMSKEMWGVGNALAECMATPRDDVKEVRKVQRMGESIKTSIENQKKKTLAKAADLVLKPYGIGYRFMQDIEGLNRELEARREKLSDAIMMTGDSIT